jgi:hypothetical protein
MNRPKALSIVAGVVVVFFLLAVVAVVAVRIAFPPQRVKRMVVHPLREALDREVTVDDAAVTVFPRVGLRLENLTIANARGAGFGDRPMVILDRAILTLAILPLLQRNLVITRTLLRGPDILIETTAEGTTNLAGLGGPPADGGDSLSIPFPITLRRVRLTDGSVTYRSAADTTVIYARDISQRLSVRIEQEPPVVRTEGHSTVETLVMGKRGAAAGERPPLKIRHTATAYLRERRLVVDTTVMGFGESTAGVGGVLLSGEEGGMVRMRFSAKVIARSFNEMVGGTLFGDGEIRARGRIAGPLDEGLGGVDILATAVIDNLTLTPAVLAVPVVLDGDAGVGADSARVVLRSRAGRSRAILRATARAPMLMLAARDSRPVPRVRFTLESPRILLDELLGADEGKEGREGDGARLTDTIPLLVAPLLPVTTDGTIACDLFDYRGITIENIEGTVAGDTARAVVDMSGTYAGGALRTRLVTARSPAGAPVVSQSLGMREASAGEITEDILALVPGESALVRTLRQRGAPVYGRSDVSLELDARGPTMANITESLSARLDALVREGRFDEAPVLRQLLEVVQQLTAQRFALTFDTLRTMLRVDTGTVLVDTLSMEAPTGRWFAHGMADLDGVLDLIVTNRLPAALSRKVLNLAGSVDELLAETVEGTLLSEVFGALGAGKVPTDEQGLVSLRFGIEGTASDPAVRFLGFGPGDGGGVEGRIREKEQELRRRLEEREESLREELEEKKRKLIPDFPSP